MHQHHGTLRLLYVLVGLVLIGAAIYLVLAFGIPHSVSTSPVATSSPPQFPIASTTAPAPVPQPEPVATSTPPISATSTTQSGVVLTNADNNTTVTLQKGEDFTVQLGDNLNWTLDFDPSTAVTKLSGVANKTSQGTYEATNPGTVILKGSGAPICTPEEACPQFLAVFTVTLVIQ